MKKFILFIIILLLKALVVEAQTGDTVRLCVWNLQTFDSTESQERLSSIRTVLQAVQPDIFVIQGFPFDSTSSFFNTNIVQNLQNNKNYGEVKAQYKTPQALKQESRMYYNYSKLILLGDTSFFYNDIHQDFACKFSFNDSGTKDTFNIVSTMFDEKNEGNRDGEGMGFMVWYSDFLQSDQGKTAIVGALYFKSWGEFGYRALVSGRGSDPLGREAWHSDSANFSSMYTNSTRADGEIRCDTTQGNGLKYRYDYILHRRALIENYIPNSYTVFGNDGLDRRNSSITDPPNQAVSQEIAEALECASSHLPVYADYVFGKTTSIEETSAQTFHLSATPNPASAQSLITFTLLKESAVKLSVFDVSGNEVLKLFSGQGSLGENRFVWNTENLPQGVYFIRLEADGKSAQVQCAVVR